MTYYLFIDEVSTTRLFQDLNYRKDLLGKVINKSVNISNEEVTHLAQTLREISGTLYQRCEIEAEEVIENRKVYNGFLQNEKEVA